MNNYRNKPQYLAPHDDSQTDMDFSVLADRKSIQNIAKNICDVLRHPVTILDVNRLGEMADTVRIDSDIEYLSLRISCKLLRYYAGEDMCHKCDHFHASMLQGMTQSMSKDNLIERISARIKNRPLFFVPSYTTRPPEVHEVNYQHNGEKASRLVIEYHCPLLGYRELLFPIFYDNEVIGVLFVGQTIVCDRKDEKTILNIKKDFFETPANSPEILFNNFLYRQKQYYNKNGEKNKILEANELKDRILNADKQSEILDNYFLEFSKISKNTGLANMTFEFYDDYEDFISEACQELSKVEQNLLDSRKTKRKEYLKNIVDRTVKIYFENITSNRDISKQITYSQLQNELKSAWDCFFDATKEIEKNLDLEEVLLFGDGTRVNMGETMKKYTYFKDPKSKQYNDIYYDFSVLDNMQPSPYEPSISLKCPSMLNGLSSTVDRTNIILLIFPDVVISLRVSELEEYCDIYEEIAESVGRGFSRIYSDVALRSANFIKERHILTLRMFRHESSHISTRLNDNIEKYFAIKNLSFLDQEREKQEHIAEDIKSTIPLISHMAKNIGVIIGSINVRNTKKKKELDVVNLLYKWQIMFRKKLKGRNLDIQVLRNYYTEKLRYIKTDPDLFELLMYNLVDNAVKYAYEGSVIRIGWSRSIEDTKYYELTVSSYGPQMEKGKRLYELYTRGKKTDTVEGDGMGLYVVERINELLELNGVTHTCGQIAPYNIPLISWYLLEPFGDDPFHKTKKNELYAFISRLHRLDINNVINDNINTLITREDLTQEFLDAYIDKETWLTTFVLKVPVNLGIYEI